MSKLDKRLDRIAAVMEWSIITPLWSKLSGSDRFDLLSEEYQPVLKMKFDNYKVKFWVKEDETIKYKSDKGYTGTVETFENFIDLVYRRMYNQPENMDDVKFTLKFLGIKCKFKVDSKYNITYRYVKGNNLYKGTFDKPFIDFYKKMLEDLK